MRKYNFILIIVIIGFFKTTKCYAQTFSPEKQYQIDSLKSSLQKNLHDTNRVKTLNLLGQQFMYNNPDTSFSLSKKALKLSVKLNWKKGIANSYSKLGIYSYLKSDYLNALEYDFKSLQLFNDLSNNEGIIINLSNIGNIYEEQSDYPKALEYYLKALKINESTQNKDGIATNFGNIGLVYIDQSDYPKALEYFSKALTLNKQLNNKKRIANNLGNIGIVYWYQSNYEEALENNLKALKLHEELGYKNDLAADLCNIAMVYEKQAKEKGNELIKDSLCKSAFDYYFKALDLAEEIHNNYGYAIVLNNIGALYLFIKNYDKSEEYLIKAINYDESIGSLNQLMDAKSNISILYDTLGYLAQKNRNWQFSATKYKQSLEFYKQWRILQDTIYNEEKDREITRRDMNYQFDKTMTLQKAEQEKKDAIAEEEKKRQLMFMGLIVAVALAIAIIAGIIFRVLHITRKQKQLIEEQKAVVEEKNQEILDSITYAKRIQNAILPPAKVVKEYLQESFILYKPKDIVAGDFYWMESVAPTGRNKEQKVLFAAADCTGHGVPGAMVSVVCNNALNRSVREYGLTDPGEILNKTRDIVIQEFEKSDEEVKDGMDIALCSLEGNVLKYAGAHNPLWIARKGEIIEIKANKQPIGKFDNPEPYTSHHIELMKGDNIYIFSDGYADQFGGEKGKKYKTANFKKLLLSINHEPMEQQKELINRTFESWKGDLEQLDDVCIIGVEI